jgi:hypothetical protein
MFEKAAQLKLRFESPKGLLTVEQLYDLSLDALDSMARAVNTQLKAQVEGSFIPNKKNTTDNVLELKLALLKHIIVYKADKETAKKKAVEKRAQLEMLKDIQARKATEALTAASLEEISQMIKQLEAEL